MTGCTRCPPLAGVPWARWAADMCDGSVAYPPFLWTHSGVTTPRNMSPLLTFTPMFTVMYMRMFILC